MYKSVIKKNKEKHDKIILRARVKLNIKEVFLSKALNDSEISFDKFQHASNVLKEYNDIRKPIKRPNNDRQRINVVDISREACLRTGMGTIFGKNKVGGLDHKNMLIVKDSSFQNI